MMNVRNVFVGLIVSGVLAGIVSCGGGGGGYSSGSGSGGGGAPAMVIRSASLNGTQAGTGSTGTGRGAVVVNPSTMEITGGVTFTGLTTAPTGAHIHRLDGTIAISLVQAADNATATIPADTMLSSTDYTQLLAGYLYFNVHSSGTTGGCAPPADCANGEIRGQITGTTGVTAGLATLNGAQETPPNASTATGRGTIVFDSTTGDILICYVTHNVVGTNVAHIHTGAPGASGLPVVALTQGTNIYYAPFGTNVATHVTDINAGNTYFNVHSQPNFPNGEIRGQIAVQ